MKFKTLATIAILLITFLVSAQTSQLTINPNINLPKDSIESKLLIARLNDFLTAADQPNEENKWILPTQKIETFIILDEINGIQKSDKFEDDFFYQPYLTNVVTLEEEQYLVRVSYIGINENQPLLRASFELIAHKMGTTFLFSSPLLRNTKHWQTAKVNNCIFHYKTTINKPNTIAYEQNVSQFDEKLKLINQVTEIYCCDNLVELLKLAGVDYKSDYNGMQEGATSSLVEDRKLTLQGNNNAHFDEFDPHDLWHARLSLLVSRREVNRPVDEACAYLYGGSWGISWNEIQSQFMTKIASNKESDWTDYKENPVNFGESQKEHLMVDYVINALIIQKLEREKGFSSVWELLNCGKYEKGNDNYYTTLKKLTGITKENYNEEVWKLISNAKKISS